jgi:peptide deformylase
MSASRSPLVSAPSRSPIDYPAALELVHYPHPILRKRASDVTVFDDALRDFCARMFDCMVEHKGVGLAAPQVAVSRRIFISDHLRREEGQSDRRVWINPRIERPAGSTTYEEGCLSFPAIYAKVERHNRFDMVAQNEWGVEHRISLDVEAGDFLGIVVQHELDHLDGKVFVDLLSPDQLSLIRRRLKELEQAFKKATGKAGAVLRR